MEIIQKTIFEIDNHIFYTIEEAQDYSKAMTFMENTTCFSISSTEMNQGFVISGRLLQWVKENKKEIFDLFDVPYNKTCQNGLLNLKEKE